MDLSLLQIEEPAEIRALPCKNEYPFDLMPANFDSLNEAVQQIRRAYKIKLSEMRKNEEGQTLLQIISSNDKKEKKLAFVNVITNDQGHIQEMIRYSYAVGEEDDPEVIETTVDDVLSSEGADLKTVEKFFMDFSIVRIRSDDPKQNFQNGPINLEINFNTETYPTDEESKKRRAHIHLMTKKNSQGKWQVFETQEGHRLNTLDMRINYRKRGCYNSNRDSEDKPATFDDHKKKCQKRGDAIGVSQVLYQYLDLD